MKQLMGLKLPRWYNEPGNRDHDMAASRGRTAFRGRDSKESPVTPARKRRGGRERRDT